jgi:L-ascorbate metabolism protein UlaG (beta-lactamase superfamily)
MNISWYGHRCVRIEIKEGSALLDPFESKEVGLRGPAIKDDVVALSAFEQPAAVLDRINDDALIIRGAGEYEKKGIAIRGIQAYQDSQEGRELGLCTIYSIIAEDMNICFLGALGQDKLTDEQLELIGDPDILIIPVGGQSAFDPKAAAELAMKIEPKVIIPIQFSLAAASYEAEDLEKFVKEMGLPKEKADTFRIQKKQLPMDKTLLVVLEA